MTDQWCYPAWWRWTYWLCRAIEEQAAVVYECPHCAAKWPELVGVKR